MSDKEESRFLTLIEIQSRMFMGFAERCLNLVEKLSVVEHALVPSVSDALRNEMSEREIPRIGIQDRFIIEDVGMECVIRDITCNAPDYVDIRAELIRPVSSPTQKEG